MDGIFSIVGFAKNGGSGLDIDSLQSSVCGWMTRPLFVTGPGLLGDIWRKHFFRRYRDGDGDGVPDSYATMAPYFRLFFEGNGRIGYFYHSGKYIPLLDVYDGYHDEYNHMTRVSNCIPHYTVLWSKGILWGGGVPPPNDGKGVPPPNDGTTFNTPEHTQSITRAYPEHTQSIHRAYPDNNQSITRA